VVALLRGGVRPRRHGPRRSDDVSITSCDWHDPKWLLVGLMILLLSLADAILTLWLLGQGAWETNPLMAVLLGGGARTFALAKIGLTGLGVVLLSLLARGRAFGRVPVGSVMYGILIGYLVLVCYELYLIAA